MFSGYIKRFKKIFRKTQHKNVVEACHSLACLRKFLGVSVISIKCTSENLVSSSVCSIGVAFYLTYLLLYLYSSYEVLTDNHTLLENYYNSKLKHYGEAVERISTTVYILYCHLKIPFDSYLISSIQLLVDVDKAIRDLGQRVDYSGLKYLPYVFMLFQTILNCTRIFSLSLPLHRLSVKKLFHMMYFDDLMLVMTSSYCFYLYLLHLRYKNLNRILQDIKERRRQQLFMYVGNRRIPGTVCVQEKYDAEKIRRCSEIYDILYRATNVTNNRFAYSLWFTLGLCLLYIVLYLYYFMEATASGLFHDPTKYVDFVVYVSWQIGYAILIIFLHIYYSEKTVKQARKTPQIAHAIINSNLDAVVKSEAINLSLQVLHQVPVFAGCGLHKLDYELFLEGFRSVVTFLVIMLQFVTDGHSQ